MGKTAYEVNFDGLVGPTHNHAGLARGNLAATKNKDKPSNPKAAALEGLAKMRFVADLGVRQTLLPPPERPAITMLRRLGFTGTDASVVENAYRENRVLLASCYSASNMWAANAATVSPSADTEDGRVHITPANLVAHFHRSIEPAETARILKAIFRDPEKFVHHEPLPAVWHFGDEGAANHIRLCQNQGAPGIEIFVYGRSAFDDDCPKPRIHPARQTLEACRAIARRHCLRDGATVFVQQNPDAIDGGAFHSDVVLVGNENVLLYHANAFADGPDALDQIRRVFAVSCNGELDLISVSPDRLLIQDAVDSYLFNSQLLSLPDGSMHLIAPSEARENVRAQAVVEDIVGPSKPIHKVHYLDVRQSMRNGGGPACLRLRVVLTEDELTAVHQGCLLTDSLYERLRDWIVRRYREELKPEDLRAPQLIEESRAALDELTQILGLGSIYPFQGVPG